MTSYCGAVPIESESKILIESCLAQLREDARLDEEPVLPPLDVLLGKPPKRLVFTHQKPLPSATDIVRGSTVKKKKASKPAFLTQSALPPEPTITTSRPMQRFVRRLRWPVMLCGFVAGVFGGAAFMKSPAARKPVVQHTVAKAKLQGANLLAAVHLSHR